MRRRHGLAIGAPAALLVLLMVARPTHHVPLPAPSQAQATASTPTHREIGFHSRELLAEHFEKHGREFGAIDMNTYLRLAQSLRDRPSGGDRLETTPADGANTRSARANGPSLSFDPDPETHTF